MYIRLILSLQKSICNSPKTKTQISKAPTRTTKMVYRFHKQFIKVKAWIWLELRFLPWAKRISPIEPMCKERARGRRVDRVLSVIEVSIWSTGRPLEISRKSIRIFIIWVSKISILNYVKTQRKLTSWTTIHIQIIIWTDKSKMLMIYSSPKNWGQFTQPSATVTSHRSPTLFPSLVGSKLDCRPKHRVSRIYLLIPSWLNNSNWYHQKGPSEP